MREKIAQSQTPNWRSFGPLLNYTIQSNKTNSQYKQPYTPQPHRQLPKKPLALINLLLKIRQVPKPLFSLLLIIFLTPSDLLYNLQPISPYSQSKKNTLLSSVSLSL